MSNQKLLMWPAITLLAQGPGEIGSSQRTSRSCTGFSWAGGHRGMWKLFLALLRIVLENSHFGIIRVLATSHLPFYCERLLGWSGGVLWISRHSLNPYLPGELEEVQQASKSLPILEGNLLGLWGLQTRARPDVTSSDSFVTTLLSLSFSHHFSKGGIPGLGVLVVV